MVVAKPLTPTISNISSRNEKIQVMELPTIDMSCPDRTRLASSIVKASEEFGFFKVTNHRVPQHVIDQMEKESFDFFGKPTHEKQLFGPPNPFGYGSKTIGLNGDVGEVEYLLLNPNPLVLINLDDDDGHDHGGHSNDHPTHFRKTVKDYTEAVREVACEILELMAEGLWVPDTSAFSKLIWALDSDSIFRLNHYPPLHSPHLHHNHPGVDTSPSSDIKVGFGEHYDPQILTILRSNDVGGLQISLPDGTWVPVPPDPTSFWVNIGDSLQAMTNGRFKSVRHRAVTNSNKSRMSMAYFGAPPLNALVTAPEELVTPTRPSIYRPFTWAEYKKATYSLRLGDSRLFLFNNNNL